MSPISFSYDCCGLVQEGKCSYSGPNREKRISHKNYIEGNTPMAEWFKPTDSICIECIQEKDDPLFQSP
jgi:hypothetical protein